MLPWTAYSGAGPVGSPQLAMAIPPDAKHHERRSHYTRNRFVFLRVRKMLLLAVFTGATGARFQIIPVCRVSGYRARSWARASR
jgi:hypothetical protein